jgi:hypothetical protein
MELTKEEKKTIADILAKHLQEVQKNEKLIGQRAGMFGAELSYEEYLKGIIKKLS